MKLPALCNGCNKSKRVFWEVQYEMDCIECRDLKHKKQLELRLKADFDAGKIKLSELTPLGRAICLGNKT
jgi:hypothetical protein